MPVTPNLLSINRQVVFHQQYLLLSDSDSCSWMFFWNLNLYAVFHGTDNNTTKNSMHLTNTVTNTSLLIFVSRRVDLKLKASMANTETSFHQTQRLPKERSDGSLSIFWKTLIWKIRNFWNEMTEKKNYFFLFPRVCIFDFC